MTTRIEELSKVTLNLMEALKVEVNRADLKDTEVIKVLCTILGGCISQCPMPTKIVLSKMTAEVLETAINFESFKAKDVGL